MYIKRVLSTFVLLGAVVEATNTTTELAMLGFGIQSLVGSVLASVSETHTITRFILT